MAIRCLQKFDFGKAKSSCPGDLKSLLDDNESITWRRKRHERRAMLEELLHRAGPSYRKHFQKREELSSQRRTSAVRRVSVITSQALWFNQHFYLRLALALNTANACLQNGRVIVCMGSGQAASACWTQ